MELLVDYRKRIFKPKNFRKNTNNDNTIIELMRSNSFINNNNTFNDDKILEKLTHVYSYPNRSSLFHMSSGSISSTFLSHSRTQINENETFYNRPCRILVLDLNGIQQIDSKQLNQFQCSTKPMNGNMKCQ
ncbi:unnamed protein product [Schistosoma curassoni]|uniref:STAS domain-containing protein n=1 Tax=Schistosoma curassoni TaxID=6186 RepID=A0A183L4E0_9TREM|nr:unnamed protein product [Schistosoma curassoni]